MAKTALVTGASSGIGETTAHKLHELGFTVYGAARRTDRLQKLAADGIRPLAMNVTATRRPPLIPAAGRPGASVAGRRCVGGRLGGCRAGAP